jgi:hypothetical protein
VPALFVTNPSALQMSILRYIAIEISLYQFFNNPLLDILIIASIKSTSIERTNEFHLLFAHVIGCTYHERPSHRVVLLKFKSCKFDETSDAKRIKPQLWRTG